LPSAFACSIFNSSPPTFAWFFRFSELRF
jgi:hypothetical protein